MPDISAMLTPTGLLALWSELDPELVLKALLSAAGGLWGFLKGRDALRSSRRRLRADLEILRLMDREHPGYHLVQQRVAERVQDIYGDAGSRGGWLRLRRPGGGFRLRGLRLPRALVADLLWVSLIAFHASWTLRYLETAPQGLYTLFPAALTGVLALIGMVSSKRVSGLLALLWLVGFAYATFLQVADGSYWWAFLTALGALVGILWLASLGGVFVGYERQQPVLRWSLGCMLAAGVVLLLSHLADLHIVQRSWWGLATGPLALFGVVAFSGFMAGELLEE